MVWAQTPSPAGAAHPPSPPEPPRVARPGDVFHRHWKWVAMRAVAVGTGALAIFLITLWLFGGIAWVVFLILAVVVPAVVYGLILAWKVVAIEVEADKFILKAGLIRTRRVNIPVINVQEYQQQYRSDIDRVLFHCVELHVTTAGEEPNPAFYPLDAGEAAQLTRFLDAGRKERPSDPIVRLQRQSLDSMERLTVLMIINAERLGARLEVIERALDMAERGETIEVITRFVYGAQRAL